MLRAYTTIGLAYCNNSNTWRMPDIYIQLLVQGTQVPVGLAYMIRVNYFRMLNQIQIANDTESFFDSGNLKCVG